MPTAAYAFLDPKAASALTRRTFDLRAWLQGDVITGTPTVTVDQDSALTVVSVIVDSYLVTVWLSGGTAGKTYTLSLFVQTGDGRRDYINATLAVV